MNMFPSPVKIGGYEHITTTCELDCTQPRRLCADFTTHHQTRLSEFERETGARKKLLHDELLKNDVNLYI
jgi:hypothetical protein